VIVQLRISGKAVPKGRPRFTRSGGVYTPKTTTDWEKHVRTSWIEQQGSTSLTGPLSAYIYIMGDHTAKKDVDNMAKSILDGLNKVAYADDSQIVRLMVSKIPAIKTDQVVVVLREHQEDSA
jgi:crossover junction endodeoxyribonuclease RusA